ncbi:exonuclease mut-7 homolog isoform X1 [Ctenocephalides felis]|uniref:exonuclease mut-7 homolog isoform X1 n=1 Tax=Ctenocephalides felis TaxID=7515 RepID=UPI000E6E4255|nr:exonuclease mut-7 homolog isoform X1 [Ctenocephalides felis]
MLSRKEYKEVCQWAICLNLNANITYADFVLPLILQDRQDLAEQYLDQNPHMQGILVKFLDGLLNKNSTVRTCIEPFIREHSIPEVKYDKLHPKPLSKLIARLCSKYSIGPDVCQNLNLKRNEGALNFIAHKRYVEESLNEASWNEMMQEAVGQNEEMQRELINLMVRHGDVAGALKWAQHYAVPFEYWPYALKEFSSPTFCEPEDDNWDPDPIDKKNLNICNTIPHTSNKFPMHTKQNHFTNSNEVNNIKFHCLNIPMDNIVLVDTEYLFEDMLRHGFENVTRVGLDSEWKPYFGTKPSDVALIQLSTGKNIYLLDVVELGHAHHLWKQLSIQLFENHEILKLGYGLRLDLEKIQSTLKLRNSIFCGGVGWLDLQDLTKALGRNSYFKYPYSGEPGCGDGLSALVQLCLGANLDKTNQFSNWELRPLRKEQILYAALDAHCLLEVHDVIVDVCNNCNINLIEMYDRITQNVRSPKKRNKKKNDKKQPTTIIEQVPSPFANLPTRGVDAIKVVCDSMLEGLARCLRKCGVDAISIDNSKDHDICINIAQQQQRIILTRGTAFNRLHQFVPLGYCYRVKSDPVDEQLKEVLHYYNIEVTENNIFSRCQICNNNEFSSFSRSEMLSLANINNALGNTFCGTSEQLPVNNRSWQLVRGNALNRFTKSGALIQANLIPLTVLNNVSVFYVCEGCGKCYWDGTHFGRVIAGRLKNIVKN